MYKKFLIGSLIGILGILGFWQIAANAAQTWVGPNSGCTNPGQSNCNVDGVVWNRADFNSAAVQTGNYKISGKAQIGDDFRAGGDFYFTNDAKALRVDVAGSASTLNIANYGNPTLSQNPINVNIFGNLTANGVANGSQPTITAYSVKGTNNLCINGDCRTAWPSGGGGGGSVTSVGSGNGLTGGPITGSGALAIMSCGSGQILKTNASGSWACAADDNSGGTISTVTGASGIAVTGAGASRTVSLDTTGCSAGYVWKWNGSAWACQADANNITNITGSGGITVANGAGPSPDISINTTFTNGRYVQKAGDTMTGALTINWPGYRAFTVNGGNGGGGAIYGNNSTANGYGGEFYGSFGVYASTPNDATGFYGGQFSGYSGGVNAIGSKPGGVGVLGSNGGAGSYGVEGYALNGYGGYFTNYTDFAYLGGSGYGLYSNSAVYTTGNVTGGKLCIGADCRAAWPTSGAGTITGVTAGSGLSGGGTSGNVTLAVAPAGANTQILYNNSGGLGASSNLTYDQANTRLTINKTLNVNVPGTYMGNLLTEEGIKAYNSITTADGYAHCAGDFRNANGNTVWLGCLGEGAYMQGGGGGITVGDGINGLSVTGKSSLGNDLSVIGKITASSEIDLNNTLTSGVAMRVNGAEALWYNGTYFSWGYGGTANYFADSVGIGISNPGARLDVDGRIRLGGSSGSGSAGIWFRDNTSATDQAFVGMDVYDSATVANRIWGIWFNQWNYTFKGDGTASKVGGAASWNVTSDERLKKNISPMTDALNKLTQLQGVNFDWKDPEAHFAEGRQGGFLAQDVEKVFPDWVKEIPASDQDKKIIGQDKEKTIGLPLEYDALVVESIKELKSQNEMLQAENGMLLKRLEALEAKVK